MVKIHKFASYVFNMDHQTNSLPFRGFTSALLSPIFLGIIPILAKVAYATQTDVMSVVAIRTGFAAILLWTATILFARQFIVSSTPAILSSLLAGAINGIGSIFFYASLMRIDASLGQLINISHLVFVTMFLRLAGHKVSWTTMGRVGLVILAVYLLNYGSIGEPDWLGAGMMLVGALAYAFQLAFSQRILYDIPAQTMTLYAMTGMAVVVVVGWLVTPNEVRQITTAGWLPVLLMGFLTALARLTLFMGVKHLGGLQTALLGMVQVLVTVGIAGIFLDEQLTSLQWVGAGIILISVLLARYEKDVPKFIDWWAMIYRRWKV